MYIEQAKRDRVCRGKKCKNNNKILPGETCLVNEELGFRHTIKNNYCKDCALDRIDLERKNLKDMEEALK